MRRVQGMTFIEIVIFVVVAGVLCWGAMVAFRSILKNSAETERVLAAAQLANARLELIMQNRLVNGLPTTDPCVSGSSAPCVALATYATANGWTVASSLTGTNPTTALVTVTFTSTSVVYAQSSMRLVA